MPHSYTTSLHPSFQRNNAAKGLDAECRQNIALRALAEHRSVTRLSLQHSVSRKFIYSQTNIASQALEKAFTNVSNDSEALFHIPVTKQWLQQVILSLVLTCHSSYGGVITFLQDTMDYHSCKGSISNLIQEAVSIASEINKQQDLSAIEIGAHDEIFQGGEPVLVGCDVHSTYVYLLSLEEHRDSETWRARLLELKDRGMDLNHTIGDGGKGLRSGQREAWPNIPCHGDIFHALHDVGQLRIFLENKALAAIQTLETLEQKMLKAKKKNQGHKCSKSLGLARIRAQVAMDLHEDISILASWLKDDILSLHGLGPETRQELLQFVIEELQKREHLVAHRIRPIRRMLENQGAGLLLFADTLEANLIGISYAFDTKISTIRRIQALEAISTDTNLYWEQAIELYSEVGAAFYAIQKAIRELLKQTTRASSIVENVNSRLRNYFFLRKTLGQNYLDLLQFFFNHRRYARSRCQERVGKSPKELLTGQSHPHWLELLGYTLFKRRTETTAEPAVTQAAHVRQAA